MNHGLEHLQAQTLERLAFDVDTAEWVFGFSGGLSLRVAAPWRVCRGEVIAVGWQDDGQSFGLPAPVDARARVTALLQGRRVRSAQLGPHADLSVDFDGIATLDVFNASSGYEGWQLNGPAAAYVIAQGGGAVVRGDSGTTLG